MSSNHTMVASNGVRTTIHYITLGLELLIAYGITQLIAPRNEDLVFFSMAMLLILLELIGLTCLRAFGAQKYSKFLLRYREYMGYQKFTLRELNLAMVGIWIALVLLLLVVGVFSYL